MQVVVVYRVAVPCHLVEGDVCHLQAVAWQMCVPTSQLAVFKHIVFVFVLIVHHLVGHSVGVGDWVKRVLGVRLWGADFHPTHKFLFVSGVAARGVAVVVVATAVEQAPVAHTEVCARVFSVVEVGQTEAV